MPNIPQGAPRTVEFDVFHENSTRLGSLVTWALPQHGDYLRLFPVDDPESVRYEVVRCEFEPDNIVVTVRDL
jgi:hypothetical protein